jgi:PAS domain S-box-containing protein
MKIPEIPYNEVERIKALHAYNIIDTLEEADYDFITKLASEILNTPISLISLITEDKQWFKSHHGLDVRETPREFAFCAHAINNPNDVLVINDARIDNRFCDNPLVVNDPYVIFYAGVPLVNEDGYALGTLCTIDHKPREIEQKQVDALKIIAQQVMNLLELRKKSSEIEQLNIELEKYTYLFNQSQNISKLGAWELDINSGKTIWTDEVYNIHEVTKNFDHNKENGILFYHEQDQPIVAKAIQNAVSKNKPFDVTCRFISAKNNFKWVRVTGKLINEKLIGSFQDITILKEKEKEIELQKEKLFNIISATKIGTWEWDIEKDLTIINDNWAEMIGYKVKEILPMNIDKWKEIIHPLDLIKTEKKLEDHFSGKTDFYEVEFRLKHKNGEYIWILDRGKVLEWSVNKKPIKMFGIHQNITERKKKEIELSYQENLLNALFEFSPIGIALTDYESGRYLNVNHNLLLNTGYSKEEFLQLTYWDITPNEYLEKEKKAKNEINQYGIFHSFEKEYLRKDGTRFPVMIRGFVVTDIDGNKKVWSYVEDLTAQKEAEKEKEYLKKIESLLAVTEEQNARLKNFAYIVSHNLRSHSGGISSLLLLLNEENKDLANNEMFQYLQKASENLTETIQHLNEVVEISLSGSQKSIPINLRNVINSVIDGLTITAKNSNVTIINEVNSDVIIFAIPAYLESIILNFITNGIKYKSENKDAFVKITAHNENNYTVLSFSDNGLGIDLERHKKNLFGMYKTFHKNPEAKGIGLFITKNQIESMGGKIEVESEINKGSTFKIFLPNEKN